MHINYIQMQCCFGERPRQDVSDKVFGGVVSARHVNQLGEGVFFSGGLVFYPCFMGG